MSKTRLSAALLMPPLLPSGPVAAPSRVLTMLTRSHGRLGTAYSSSSWSSVSSPGSPLPIRTCTSHLITQYCTPNGASS